MTALRTDATRVVVVFFDDMKGSTALKESLAETRDERAFQELRQEHDALLTEIITRDGAGEVLKTTGDGVLAVFYKPSVAVERAVEIQERLHGHPNLSVRIGMDMGEVRVESEGGVPVDAFGRHVDWAARAMASADGGHVVVTRAVYTDAFAWLTKSRIAWKEHGWHRVKPDDPPLELFEPCNANIAAPMTALRAERVSGLAARPGPAPEGFGAQGARIVRSWESVARDGREFAENGAGMMYWYRPPLGGICYPEGFRNFLQPALENQRITKIRFILDGTSAVIRDMWQDLVLSQVDEWAARTSRTLTRRGDEEAGSLEDGSKALSWVLVDLSREYAPVCKLLVHDPDTDEETESQAQIFLSTATRTVRMKDGSLQTVRIPDVILRVRQAGNDALLHALNSVANQWDSLFV